MIDITNNFISQKVLWTLYNHPLHWENGLQANSSSSLQDINLVFCVPCLKKVVESNCKDKIN
jgi:hypothetical protein